MKALLVVLFESFILTVFITLMSQAYVSKVSSLDCHGGIFNMKKCVNSAEATRDSLR